MVTMIQSDPMTAEAFAQHFPDEEACQDYAMRRRWPYGIECPRCQRVVKTYPRGPWGQLACFECRGHLPSVRQGTVLERSRLPLRTWYYAIWLLVQDPGMTVRALAAEVSITVKSAHALRQTVRRTLDRVEAQGRPLTFWTALDAALEPAS